MSFPGPCEWCGGTQVWTTIRGEVYVSCDNGCSPLSGLGLEPPSDSDELRRPEETPKRSEMEPSTEGGVVPCEGDDADESERSVLIHVGVPLEAVLLNLWEGEIHGEEQE